MIRSLHALSAVLLLAALAGCGDDDGPTGPGADASTIDVTIRATQLVVESDCDAMDGSASTRAGDFFVRVTLLDANDRVLDESDEVLVQLEDGQSAAVPGAVATASVPLAGGVPVKAVVSYYENDTDGPQVTATDTMTFAYDAETECWGYAGDAVCLGRTGQITRDRVILRDTEGDPCAAELYWDFLVAGD